MIKKIARQAVFLAVSKATKLQNAPSANAYKQNPLASISIVRSGLEKKVKTKDYGRYSAQRDEPPIPNEQHFS